MTGCCANGSPAVAVADGWVAITSLFAVPKLTVIGGLVIGTVLTLFVVPLLYGAFERGK